MDYTMIGNGNPTPRPELAFVIGSGMSAIEIHKFRRRLAKFPSVGVNYSYRLYLSANLLFLDYFFWAQNVHDIVKMTKMRNPVQVFCPAQYDKGITDQIDAPPIPPQILRFMPYMCAWLQCKSRYDFLSDNFIKGLTPTSSSILPAINLAYLSNPKILMIIGVELNNRFHFWDSPDWPKIDKSVNRRHDWQGLVFDYCRYEIPEDKGKERMYFPGQTRIKRDLAKAGRFLEKKGIKAYNCSLDSAVYGWEKKPLEEVLCLVEAAQSSSLATAPAAAS